MENKRWGIFLTVAAMLGLIAWLLGADLVFQYLVAEVYHSDPGEPIWVVAPHYAFLVLIPSSLLLLGLCVILFSGTPSLEKKTENEGVQ